MKNSVFIPIVILLFIGIGVSVFKIINDYNIHTHDDLCNHIDEIELVIIETE